MGDRPARDATRETWLHDHGITLLRIPTADMLKGPASTADAIVAYVREQI